MYLKKKNLNIIHCILFILKWKYNNGLEKEQDIKNYNKAIKYYDTVIIEDKNFHNLIIKMNLPYKNQYYLNEIVKFFKNPKQINNK